MISSIIFTSNVADDRFETELRLTPDGKGTLRLGSNRGNPDQPVGVFEGLVPEKLLLQLDQELSSQAFLDSPNQSSLIPDESYREFKVISPNGQSSTKMIGEQISTPDSFLSAEKTVADIINQLIQQPLVAITLQILEFPNQAKQGTLSPLVNLVVSHRGKASVHVEHPKNWGSGFTRGEIIGIRSDIPLAELRDENQVFIELTGGMVIDTSAPESTEDILLNNGEYISTSLQWGFDWPAGDYDVTVEIALVLIPQNGQSQIHVGLVSALQRIKIEG